MIRKAKTLLNRFIPLISGSVIGLGMMMFMPSAGALASTGTPLYWCGAGNTSATATVGTNVSAAANWDTVDSSCGSISLTAPGPSNDLFFDNTNLTAVQTLTNSAALEVGSINFTGSGTTYSFTITGLPIKLDGTNSGSGITSTEDTAPVIMADLILNASQSITTGLGLVVSNLDLGSNPLTVTGSFLSVNGNLSGTGNIAVNSTFADFMGASPIDTCSYSGVVTIASLSDTYVYLNGSTTPTTNALCNAHITVNDGGSVLFYDTSSAVSDTVGNQISVAGTGLNGSGAIKSCLQPTATTACTSADTTLVFTGIITLTKDALFANGAATPTHNAVFDLTGATIVTNGFGITNSAGASLLTTQVSGGGGGMGGGTGLPDTSAIKTELPIAIVVIALIIGSGFEIARRRKSALK
jgi:hypothetical protein